MGRSSELGLLRANLAWARAGEPRVVVVEGPAGMGKSALLRAFLAQVGPGVRSVLASGDEAEAHLPFGLLDQLWRAVDPDTAPTARGSDPLNAGARLVDLLGTLQDGGPVVVALDDCQWVDRPSLQALTFALRRMHADRVMAVVTTRDGPPGVPDGVRRLVDQRGQHLRLAGLDARTLAELAACTGAGRLPAAAAARFRHHTGGNPLHARALLEQLDLSELRRETGPLPAPSSYALTVVSRLAACSTATEALVTATAVLGERTPLSTAVTLAGLADPAPALEEAVAERLLEVVELASSRAVAFTHPLVRSAVYHDLGPGRRARLHARAATLTSGAVALDHRVAAALVDDPDLVRELVELAGTEAATGAWVSAAGHLVAAARLEPEVERREAILLDALGTYLRAGELPAALALVDEVKADSPRRRYVCGYLALLSGRQEEARRLLEEAWEGGQELGPELLGPVATQLGQLALLRARAEEAVAWGRRALEAAGDDLVATSSALGVITIGLGLGGKGEEALALLHQAPVGPGEVVPGNAEQIFARGVLRYYTEDLQAAGADLGAVVLAGARSGPLRTRVNGLACLAKTEYRLGAWDDSVAHADLAVSLAEDAEHAWAFAFCRSVATIALAGRGDWERAEAHARGAVEAATASGTAVDLAYAASAQAHVAFARADPAAVVAAVEPVTELWERDGFTEPSFLPWREQYADALVSLGRLEEAEAALGVFEAMARLRRRRSSLAGAARVRGRLQAARGDIEAAETTFEDALAHLEGVPTPFFRALVQDAHGCHLRRIGQRRAAAAHLRSARATYADLGARPFVERCERELAACGLSPAARSHPSPASLTPQELATARLVASGCSNREAAGELVVSVKTVEYHLGHVFAKLGISSRHRLAAALAGRDLGSTN